MMKRNPRVVQLVLAESEPKQPMLRVQALNCCTCSLFLPSADWLDPYTCTGADKVVHKDGEGRNQFWRQGAA
jgi:hypothetical protein